MAGCFRPLGTHLLTLKLSILGFLHRPLHESCRNKKMGQVTSKAWDFGVGWEPPPVSDLPVAGLADSLLWWALGPGQDSQSSGSIRLGAAIQGH